MDTNSGLERCTCKDVELSKLVASWTERVQPIVAAGVNTGRAVKMPELQLAAKLVNGIHTRDATAFDPRYVNLGHHLPDCQLHGTVESMAAAYLS